MRKACSHPRTVLPRPIYTYLPEKTRGTYHPFGARGKMLSGCIADHEWARQYRFGIDGGYVSVMNSTAVVKLFGYVPVMIS
jgi:hypothetical protein